MVSSKEHGRVVLGGIIPARIDLLNTALLELNVGVFEDPAQQKFFQFLERYYNVTNGVLSRAAFDGMLQRGLKDAARRLLYLETYDDFFQLKVDDADFLWAVHELKELAAEREMRSALEKSMEILNKGVEQPDGEIAKGQEASREFLLDRMADIDLTLSKQDAPHGNMNDESSLILSEYAERRDLRKAGVSPGVRFGILDLDTKIGGLNPGELVLSAGYSSDGKTSLCVQLAWSAAVEQGKNVLFLTTETINTTVRRKLVARHSKHAKFAEFGLPEGLNTRNLKEGTLSEAEEAFFEAVVKDFGTESDYGNVYIHQVPRGGTMEEVEQIMNKVQKKMDVDLVVMDYLALLRASAFRNSERESLSGIIKGAKQVATTFKRGAGVPFVSPWQVNRAQREVAENTGQYTMRALAETAEATNSADVIIAILAPVDNTNRYAEISGQVLKNRDGETANGLLMEVDYATSTFRSKLGLGSFNGGGLFGGGSSGLEDLLN